eukprot:g4761.t1
MQANGVVPTDEGWFLGCDITVKTILGEECSGTIFTYDRLTNLLVLSSQGSTPELVSYRFLKTTLIKEITSAKLPDEPMNNALEYLNLDTCTMREEAAARAIEMRAAPQVEVIEAGQKLFSKLVQEHSCKWEGRTINVEDKVYIDEPYILSSFRSSEEYSEFKDLLALSLDDDV